MGFIEMQVRDQAKAAIAALIDKESYGGKIALKEANRRNRKNQIIFSGRGLNSVVSGGGNTEIDRTRW